MSDIERALGTIDGKLDMLISAHREAGQRHDDLEKRVRFIESIQKWAAGVAAGAAGFVGYMIKMKTTEGL